MWKFSFCIELIILKSQLRGQLRDRTKVIGKGGGGNLLGLTSINLDSIFTIFLDFNNTINLQGKLMRIKYKSALRVAFFKHKTNTRPSPFSDPPPSSLNCPLWQCNYWLCSSNSCVALRVTKCVCCCALCLFFPSSFWMQRCMAATLYLSMNECPRNKANVFCY